MKVRLFRDVVNVENGSLTHQPYSMESEINDFLRTGKEVRKITQTSSESSCLNERHHIVVICISIWYEDLFLPSEYDIRKILGRKVSSIEWSERIQKFFANANITTIGELCQKTEHEILKYRDFGRISIAEVKEKLAKLGLGLGIDSDFVDRCLASDIYSHKLTYHLPKKL